MKVLTAKGVAGAKPKRTAWRMADKLVKGLNLVITPAGNKSFWMRYAKGGKKRQIKLGVFPDYSLEQARIDGAEYREAIDGGADPARDIKNSAAKSKLLQAALVGKEGAETINIDQAENTDPTAKEMLQLYRDAGNATVAALFTLYEADLLEGGKHTEEMLAAYKLDIQPFIGTKLACDVTSDDIADLLGAIVDRGSVRKSDVVRGYLMRAFNLGRKARYSSLWRTSTPNFNIIVNPVEVIEKAGAYNPRNRELSKEEVKVLWNDLDNFNTATALAVKLIFTTGARVTEILEAKKSEFDLEAGVWALPMDRWKIRRKAEHTQPHLVPLTATHIALLKEAMALSGKSEYLFPGKMDTLKYRSVNQAIGRYCARTGFEHFVTKDLRRSFKTLTGAAGLSLEIRNRLQGHAFSDIGSKNYDRYSYWTEKQEAMMKWERWFDRIISDEPAKVVPLKAAL